MATERDTGCLLIDDPLYDIGGLSALADALARGGLRTETFAWDRTRRLHLSLQRAYQHIRRDGAVNGIAALGAGCDCALALACQLPADRLALLEPMRWRAEGEAARQMRRIRAFARRNAAFCVADVLIVPGPHTDADWLARLRRDLNAARVTILRPGGEMWSKRKEVLNLSVFHFLRDGALPKNLAENPEMCIIYG